MPVPMRIIEAGSGALDVVVRSVIPIYASVRVKYFIEGLLSEKP